MAFLKWAICLLTLSELALLSGVEGICSGKPITSNMANAISVTIVDSQLVGFFCPQNMSFLSNDAVLISKCIMGNWTEVTLTGCGSTKLHPCKAEPIVPPYSYALNLTNSSSNMVAYQCIKGYRWLSGDIAKISQCKGGSWTDIADVCDTNCAYPRDCGDLAALAFYNNGDYYVTPSGECFGKLFKVHCVFKGTPANNGGNWTYIFTTNMSRMANNASQYISGINQWGNDTYFLGLDYLSVRSQPKNGSVPGMVLEVLFRNASNILVSWATYSNFTVGPASLGYPITSLGRYHGFAGDALNASLKKPFLFNNNTPAAQWWGASELDVAKVIPAIYGSFLTLGGTWSTLNSSIWSQTSMIQMRIRQPQQDSSKFCPPMVGYEPWWNKTSVNIPYSRQPGTQITWQCLDEYYYEGGNATQTGVSTCMNGTSPYWTYNVSLPCTFTCPNDFVMSSDGRACFYYSSDEATGIIDAAAKCMAMNASLALVESSTDLAAANPEMYYLAAYSSRGEGILNVEPALPSNVLTQCSTVQCSNENGNECTVITTPANFGFTTCNATNRYACQIRNVCPKPDYFPANGACYKAINATTFYEALTLCASEGASLAYPTSVSKFQALTNLLTKIVPELAAPGAQNPQLFFVGVNNYDGSWTVGGEYQMEDLLSMLWSSISNNHWRTMIVYPEDISAFQRTDIAAVIPGGKAVCQLFGRLECKGQAPNAAGSMTISYNGSVHDGANSTYNCYPGYFYNYNISQNFTQSTCYGLLGGHYGWIPPVVADCVALPVCRYDMFTIGSPFIISNIKIPDSYIMNGTITFTCPPKMSFLDGSLQKNATCIKDPNTGNFTFDILNIQCNVCSGTFSVMNASITAFPGSSLNGNEIGDKMIATCEPGFEFTKYQTVQLVECTGMAWNTSSLANCYRTCSNGTPPVEPSDNIDSVTVVSNYSSNKIGTYYNYKCKTAGFYFALTQSSRVVVNETFAMCTEAGHWIPDREPLQCLEMCEFPPPEPPINANSSWDGITQTINTTVTYTAAPAAGVFLNNYNTWTVICDGTSWVPIDSSSVLPFGRPSFQLLIPCSNSPPANISNAMPVSLPKGNGFVNDQVVYACPAGQRNASGLTSIILICSLTNRTWSMPTQPFFCQNLCLNKPVVPPRRTSYNYTGGISREGDVIHYTCHGGFIWGYVTAMYSRCFNGNWTITYIPKCLPVTTPQPPTPPPYVLPESSLNSQSYQKSSNLVFSDISQSFVPSSGQTGDFQTVQSLFGFGYAVGVQSRKKQCMTKENFVSDNNSCIANPINCQSGFSFAIWVRVYYNDSVYDMSSVGPQDEQYFMSTGGDAYGCSGVAIGVRKQDLFAIVSIGSQYWQVSIRGPVPNNTWTNVGISWNKNDQGLKVYVNNVIKGYQPTPQTSPKVLPLFNPPLLTIGCHKNNGDLNYSGFITADIDESSFWEKSLNGSETEYFLGGYDKNLTTLEIPKDFEKVLPKVDLRDMDQRKVALKHFAQQTIGNKCCYPSTIVASQVKTTLFDKSYLLSMPVSSKDTTDLYYSGLILSNLLNEDQLPVSIAPDDVISMMKVAESFSNLLAPCNKPNWLKVQIQTENVGAIQLISKFKKWNAKVVQNMNITDDYPFCHEQLEENLYIKFCKMTIGDLLAMAQRVELPENKNPVLQTLREMWNDMLVDRISFPTNLFNDYTCDDRLVSFIFHYYGNVQEILSTEVHPLVTFRNIDGEKMRALDSRLFSLDIVVDTGKDEYQDYDPSLIKCGIISELLQQQFVKFNLEHSFNVSAKYSRTLQQLFGSTPEVDERICVRWNDILSDFGAWDNEGCAMVATNDQYSNCACQHFGIYSILALKAAPKVVLAEPYWLHLSKYVIYSISALAVAFYIIVVLISSDLKDQLHLIGLNLAVAILVGSISMILTEFQQVKDNRDACTLFGSLIHLFYGAVGFWMVGLSHASFRGITAGIIGGYLGGYMLICWGLAIASVGIPFLYWATELGTDPRCFIGWENDVKLVFFLPQMLFCLVSLFFAVTVLCNLATPALRKENLIEDYGSFCRGAAFLVIVLCITWTLGLLTYVKFSFFLTGPDFYPIFQVLNGTSGVCLFIFIGLGSSRFNAAVRGQAAARREMLRKYAFGLPMPQDEQRRNILK